jgi:hypothetical protein
LEWESFFLKGYNTGAKKTLMVYGIAPDIYIENVTCYLGQGMRCKGIKSALERLQEPDECPNS